MSVLQVPTMPDCSGIFLEGDQVATQSLYAKLESACKQLAASSEEHEAPIKQADLCAQVLHTLELLEWMDRCNAHFHLQARVFLAQFSKKH